MSRSTTHLLNNRVRRARLYICRQPPQPDPLAAHLWLVGDFPGVIDSERRVVVIGRGKASLKVFGLRFQIPHLLFVPFFHASTPVRPPVLVVPWEE